MADPARHSHGVVDDSECDCIVVRRSFEVAVDGSTMDAVQSTLQSNYLSSRAERRRVTMNDSYGSGTR